MKKGKKREEDKMLEANLNSRKIVAWHLLTVTEIEAVNHDRLCLEL
jgi:hypothetical protein